MQLHLCSMRVRVGMYLGTNDVATLQPAGVRHGVHDIGRSLAPARAPPDRLQHGLAWGGLQRRAAD